MAELDKKDPVSPTELMVSTLAMADAITKLLLEIHPHWLVRDSPVLVDDVNHPQGLDSQNKRDRDLSCEELVSCP